MIDDHVAEVGLAPVVVGERGVVHHLEQDVEEVGVRLLDLVEHQHRVRRLADGVGQQPALVEADVARRRADQPRHGVLLHVLGHVEAQELDAQHAAPAAWPARSCRRRSGPRTGTMPIGFSGDAEARARQLDGRRQRVDGLVLAEDDLLQLRLEVAAAPPRRSADTDCARDLAPSCATTSSISRGAERASCARSASQPIDGAGLVDHVDRLVGQVAIVDVLGRQLGRRLRAPRRCSRRRGAPRSASCRPFRISTVSVDRSARARRSSGSGAPARGRARSDALYSLKVVEPMQRSSPDASAGLSMFDASIEPPVVAPAPTMVWISSMKRIAFGVLLDRLDHALEPLLELAAELGAREQRAHVERVDDLRPSSGSRHLAPRGSRSARPSTMAVLPTPGSPTKSGLFLRRRASTWMVRSSSVGAADQRIDLARAPLLDQVDGVGLERILGRLAARPRRRRSRRPRRRSAARSRRRRVRAILRRCRARRS